MIKKIIKNVKINTVLYYYFSTVPTNAATNVNKAYNDE